MCCPLRLLCHYWARELTLFSADLVFPPAAQAGDSGPLDRGHVRPGRRDKKAVHVTSRCARRLVILDNTKCLFVIDRAI